MFKNVVDCVLATENGRCGVSVIGGLQNRRVYHFSYVIGIDFTYGNGKPNLPLNLPVEDVFASMSLH